MAFAGLRSTFSLNTTSFLGGLQLAKIEYERRANRAITKGALFLVGEIKKELSSKGTGKTYRRGGKVHVASPPGSPPAVDTGRLRASITHLVEKEFFAWVATVGTNVEYAPALEFGTNKMEARPFMITVLTRIRPQLLKIFEIELSG